MIQSESLASRSDPFAHAASLPRLRRPTQTELAVGDLVDGIRRWRLWATMAAQDIHYKYRRSLLGPFWLTLSMAIFIGALSVLYSTLFNIPPHKYIPFLTSGFLAWNLISTIINEGCTVFTASEALIKQIKLPLTCHVYRMIWRNLIIFAHNIVVFVVVAVIFGVWPGMAGLLLLLGLALIVVNSVWVAILMGLLCTRFRDIPQIVTNVVQVVFFITPIFWTPETLGGRMVIVDANPFYHFVELIRGPLLGQVPSALTYIVTGGLTLVGSAVAFGLFVRFRKRVAYWL